MVATTYSYRPDYAVPPGWVLEEHLKSHSLSPAELAPAVRPFRKTDQRNHCRQGSGRAQDRSAV